MRVIILGCGASGGVPLIGCECPVCQSENPCNKRRRVSILVEDEATRLLVDASPDLRAQLLYARVGRLDAVLFTHDHADHVHGIDDLRAVNHQIDQALDAHGRAEDLASIAARFGYAFAPIKPGHGWYKPQLVSRAIEGPFRVGTIDVIPFEQRHGRKISLGFRFGALGYSTDVNELDEAAFAALAGIDTWIVDCQDPRPNPVHAYPELVFRWIERIKPRRTILTHMNHEMDYETLCAELPANVEPAHDGMVILSKP